MFTGFLLHRRNANRAPSTRGQASRNRIDFARMKQKNKNTKKKWKKDTTRVHARVHGLVEGAENVKIEIDGMMGIVCARNLRRERNEYLPRVYFYPYNLPLATIFESCANDLSNPPRVKMACALKRANGNKGGWTITKMRDGGISRKEATI